MLAQFGSPRSSQPQLSNNQLIFLKILHNIDQYMEKLSRDFLPLFYITRAAAVIVVATIAIDGQGSQPRCVQKKYSDKGG